MPRIHQFSLRKKLAQKFLTLMGAFAFTNTIFDNLKNEDLEPWQSGLIFTVGTTLLEDLIEVLWHFTHVPSPADTIRQAFNEDMNKKICIQTARSLTKTVCAGITGFACVSIEYRFGQFTNDLFLRNLTLSFIAGSSTILAEKAFDTHWSPAGLLHRLLANCPEKEVIEASIPLHEDAITLQPEDTWLREMYKLLKGASELDFNLNLIHEITGNKSFLFDRIVISSVILLTMNRIRRRLERWAYKPDEMDVGNSETPYAKLEEDEDNKNASPKNRISPALPSPRHQGLFQTESSTTQKAMPPKNDSDIIKDSTLNLLDI